MWTWKNFFPLEKDAVTEQTPLVVVISAHAEWRVVKQLFADAAPQNSPYGEWFAARLDGREVIFLYGGWGKIAAAGSAQYALDRWKPDLLMNVGTCGGFAGSVARGELLLVDETLVYDIIEQMGDPQEAIAHYCTRLDLSWLRPPYPQPVRRARLLSADRDILAEQIPMLVEQYQAIAADWESGAIAWVAQRNQTRCLILRGVSDLVGESGGEAYGAVSVFHEGTRQVMESTIPLLPHWLACAG